MRTATVQQAPQLWPEILRWVAAGEEVQITDDDRVIARVIPGNGNGGAGAGSPDFLSRARAIWGDEPQGKPLSQIVAEQRGGDE